MKSTIILLWTLFLLGPGCFGQSTEYQSIIRQEASSSAGLMTPLTPVMQALYDQYDVQYYHLDLKVENDTSFLSGRVDMRFRVNGTSLDTLALEMGSGLQVDSIKADGLSRAYLHSGDTLLIFFDPALLPGTIMTLSTWYHGNPPASGFFSGMSSAYFPQWQSHVTWTLSEPWMAKEWWPAKQDLGDKADSSSVFVTTSANNKVGSNGLLKAVVPLAGNKVRYEWRSGYPIDYYLISLAVGPYQDYSIYAKPEGMTDSILVQNYIFDVPGCLQQYQANIDKTPVYIELFSKLVSLYPFRDEKYGHCLVYLGGAMEHQTMTSTGDFGPDLVSHELFHQWFGDNVTCATWNDIWINEGFATYGTYLARQYTEGQPSADAFMQGVHDVVMSAPDGSVYIPDSQTDNVFRIFDGRLSYNKGAAIIHMLRFEMNDDSLFFKTLKNFQQQYGGNVATGLDFKAVAESVSALDFTDFFDQWYFGEGYPTVYVNYLLTGDSLLLRLAQSPSAAVTPLFKMSLAIKILYPGGDTTLRLYLDQAMQYYSLPFQHEVNQIVVDPDGWCLLKVGGIQEGIGEQPDKVFIQVFPNPAKDKLNILVDKFSAEVHECYVTDLTGRIVKRFSVTDNLSVLNIEELGKGVYFIVIFRGDSQIRKKFIKY